jgi:N-acetylmuramoyl-L-alanine amidase
MARWARVLLVASMVVWTALTAGLGVLAASGGEASSRFAGEDALVVYNVAAPGSTPDVRLALRDAATPAAPTAAAAAPAAAPTPGNRQRSSSSIGSYPVPRYAGAAVIEPRARAIDPNGPRPAPDKTRTPARGVVVLDPGHGRGDPGATHYLPDGTWDITEAESNWRNAELIRDELHAMGYEVYLTREGDGAGPDGPLPLQFISSDLWRRVQLAKAVDADVFLAIHGNGATVTSIRGPETWYCGRHIEGAANELFALMMQNAMMEALREYGYDAPDRGIKEDAQTHHSGDFCQFVVTREADVPAALIEFLFLTNDDDARVLVDDRAHVILARHIAGSIDQFVRLLQAEGRPVASCVTHPRRCGGE